jgi:hypothetical protein
LNENYDIIFPVLNRERFFVAQPKINRLKKLWEQGQDHVTSTFGRDATKHGQKIFSPDYLDK